MAYLQSLSGIARSGVTYCGWTKPRFRITIGGTDRTALIHQNDLEIDDELGLSSCSFTVHSFTPVLGSDVKVRYTAKDDWMFGGTIVTADCEVVSSSVTLWHCTAYSYVWLLRHTPVTAEYMNQAINVIVHDLLARFTLGDFKVGYVPGSLPYLSIRFEHETIPQCLSKLAAAAQAWWEVTPAKIINLAQTYPAQTLALTNSTLAQRLHYRRDLTDVRTREYVIGRSTSVTSNVGVGATTIPVADTYAFDTSTIYPLTAIVLSGANSLVYSGTRSVVMGPGTITTDTAVTAPIASGDRIAIGFSYTNSTAATALASVLGTPSDGIIIYWIVDEGLSLTACYNRAVADTTKLSEASAELAFDLQHRYVHTGHQLVSTMTSPVNTSGTYLIVSVRTTPLSDLNDGIDNVTFIKEIRAGSFYKTLIDRRSEG